LAIFQDIEVFDDLSLASHTFFRCFRRHWWALLTTGIFREDFVDLKAFSIFLFPHHSHSIDKSGRADAHFHLRTIAVERLSTWNSIGNHPLVLDALITLLDIVE
jgi:hypothetical protein